MIIRLLHLSILYFLVSSMAVTQSDPNNMFYKRYENDSDTLTFKANFVQMEEKLSGNYELSAIDIETTTVEIDGFINENSLATINQLGNDNLILQGVFFDDRFTGIWNPGKNGKEIELYESYPEGSIPLNIHYLRSETSLIEDDVHSPTAEIELTIIYPESFNANDSLLNNIEKNIQAHFLSKQNIIYNPDSLLIKIEKDFFNSYKELNKDWHESGNSFDWLKETSMSVTYNSDYILCLEYLDYVYSGGAHGMTYLSHDIFSLKSGNKIVFNDIFNDNSKEKLSEILTKQIRHSKQIPDSIPLTKAGYFVDVIEPGENIYINGSGIGFVYNPYEIAPYSSGITNIFVPYKQLGELLNDETILY